MLATHPVRNGKWNMSSMWPLAVILLALWGVAGCEEGDCVEGKETYVCDGDGEVCFCATNCTEHHECKALEVDYCHEEGVCIFRDRCGAPGQTCCRYDLCYPDLKCQDGMCVARPAGERS